jgi:branched-chain amino acid transport system permease protein
MLFNQLLADGLVTGCAIGMVAISFAFVYSTTRVFHVAHAGVYTLGAYIAWFAATKGVPFVVAALLSVLGCAAVGALIQHHLYDRLERWGATPLVLLISSLGLLAILTNAIAAVFSPDILRFPNEWRIRTVGFGGINLSYAQIIVTASGLLILGGLLMFTRGTSLGKRIRAVASNPYLAEITRLRPREVYVYVMAIASGIVAVAGTLVSLDQALQPYTGILVLLTATIAVIAGGIGSLTGAFALSVMISVLQNVSLVVMSGKWGIAATFGVFIVFMIVRPEGLFRKR